MIILDTGNIVSPLVFSLPTIIVDRLIFAKILVIFVRFREVLRPWSCFYQEYEHNVNSFMQIVLNTSGELAAFRSILLGKVSKGATIRIDTIKYHT